MAVFSEILIKSLAIGSRLDPEYYQPRYLDDDRRLEALDCCLIGKIASVTDGIHSSPDEVEEDGVRYLSAKCVKNNDFALGSVIYISEKQHASNPRTQLRPDDVLITTVGTIGNSAVVQPDFLPANSDRHLGIIRIDKDSGFDPYFIAAFLNSEYGRFQSTREATGNVQLNLFIEKIKALRVPRLRCAERVASLTKQAYAKRLAAGQAIETAEKMVSTTLGIEATQVEPSLFYVSSRSEMSISNRLGAEFFMPAKSACQRFLSGEGSQPLSHFVISVRDNWDPNTATGAIRNFDLSDAIEPFLDNTIEPTNVNQIKSSKRRLREGDVVISRLRSYLKQIAVVRTSEDCVGSSEFIVLRPTGDLPSETLLAFLRSEPVQTILRWSQDGTNHPRFDEKTLMSIPVPMSLLRHTNEIAQPVKMAIHCRQKMVALLRQADDEIASEVATQKPRS